MKVGIPPVGSVSPCVRMFLESLIREVEDASVPGVRTRERRLEFVRDRSNRENQRCERGTIFASDFLDRLSKTDCKQD